MTLYEIGQQFIELQNIAEDEEIDAEVLQDTFEALEGEFEEKADGYTAVIKNLEMYAKALSDEADRMIERSQRYKSKAVKLNEILLKHMKLVGKEKFETERFTYKINKGRGSVVIDKEDEIPFNFMIPTTKIDKMGISKFLKSLGEDDKCEFAHLEFNDSLSIK